ncbi:uncharacterized protein LOC110006513 [Amborella trichopoda]|uniref:uncharacterized protein LOC110006513 n=1 Tax=Amborella trichopoda TaxID=13333 RepID=UPI0009C069AE|nr:uncharacterized protein LOC110006513 [Amborella trichopoda]|eukprot:XP_020517874.1 uncharacterized protein LOC110006513 [Amborella trichopoda]
MDLLCRHMLKVFMVNNVFKIPPPQYIMRHLRNDIKNGAFIDESDNQIQETTQLPRSIRYNGVYQATRYLIERASESAELHEFIMAIIRRVICQVDSRFRRKGGPHSDVTINCNAEKYGNVETNANIDENAVRCSDTPIERDHCQNILEPPQGTKGRPTNKRKKAQSEGWKPKENTNKSKEKTKKCALCKGSGHDKRNCLSFIRAKC